ncbi:hypothetical protein BKA93DRAFT_779785 [Sparassis latifolia]
MLPALPSFLLLSICSPVIARLHHSLVPEDPYAFPKFRVAFLNGLPVLNDTAERWLNDGLRGGEPEFLDQTWRDPQWQASQFKSIEGAEDTKSPSAPAPPRASDFTLQHLRLGALASYLCLIPPPPEENFSIPDEPQTDVTPVHSWSLLQPLAGTCLFHKQGWFTYSYCHNLHVRQFHELPHQNRVGGEYQPEEDNEWESYTLGKAPPSLEGGADLTVAEQAAVAANVELARGAGSRYLVQRWGDGSYCEKTGRRREIEVQFHCSMTMPDTILFVKETQTCHYVLHIATPRLCGEPGFKSRHDAREEAYIRCREVVDAEEYASIDKTVPPADHPTKKPKHRKQIVAPPPPHAGAGVGHGSMGHNDVFRRALEHILTRGDLKSGDPQVVVEQPDDGEMELFIEFIDNDLNGNGDGHGDGDTFTLSGDALADVLRAAGYDIKGEKDGGSAKRKTAAKVEDAEEATESRTTQRRDEL